MDRPQAIVTSDGVGLHTESVGRGNPILFVHEYAGDHRSWEPQVRRFSRSHRCITYAARGYPPSQVPADAGAYSQRHAVDDAVAVLDGLGVEAADIVGISMGGFAGLHLAMQHPARVRSLVVLGTGYGARPAEAAALPRRVRGHRPADSRVGDGVVRPPVPVGTGAGAVPEQGPSRVGEARAAAGGARPGRSGSHHARRAAAAAVAVRAGSGVVRIEAPVLIVAGDEDDGCLATSLWLKRVIPRSGLAVLPKSGHTLNLEEPDLVNGFIADFLGRVAAGAWGPRDPRATPGAITGMS